jgi:hypothetical protein
MSAGDQRGAQAAYICTKIVSSLTGGQMVKFSAAFVIAACFSCSSLVACECGVGPVRRVPRGARVVERTGVVFRGRITKIEYLDPEEVVHYSSGEDGHVPRRFRATLDVSRVWQGTVTQTFVLYTREEGGGDCIGFPSEVGREMLVYGSTEPADDHFLDGVDLQGQQHHTLWYGWLDLLPKGQLITSPGICSFTMDAADAEASGVIKKLGRGRAPNPDP